MSSERKKRTAFGDWGFFLILALCVAVLGTAGYLFFFSDDAVQTAYTTPRLEDVMNKWTSASLPQLTTAASTAASTATSASAASITTTTTASAAKTADFFIAPVPGEVLNAFSGDELVYDNTMGDWRTHNGTDFACENGEQVCAIADGKVQDVYQDDYYGIGVLIDHGNGYQSVYTGLSDVSESLKGENVSAGDILGCIDGSALFESALAPHLHLEVLKDGVRIDPMSLLPS